MRKIYSLVHLNFKVLLKDSLINLYETYLLARAVMFS